LRVVGYFDKTIGNLYLWAVYADCVIFNEFLFQNVKVMPRRFVLREKFIKKIADIMDYDHLKERLWVEISIHIKDIKMFQADF